jgi:hypothetical protein
VSASATSSTGAVAPPTAESPSESARSARTTESAVATTLVGIEPVSTTTFPLSLTNVVVRSVAESAAATVADESGLSSACIRAAFSASDGSSCTSQAPHAIATNASTPNDFHIKGVIGARSGLVPHHLQEPTASG